MRLLQFAASSLIRPFESLADDSGDQRAAARDDAERECGDGIAIRCEPMHSPRSRHRSGVRYRTTAARRLHNLPSDTTEKSVGRERVPLMNCVGWRDHRVGEAAGDDEEFVAGPAVGKGGEGRAEGGHTGEGGRACSRGHRCDEVEGAEGDR